MRYDICELASWRDLVSRGQKTLMFGYLSSQQAVPRGARRLFFFFFFGDCDRLAFLFF